MLTRMRFFSTNYYECNDEFFVSFFLSVKRISDCLSLYLFHYLERTTAITITDNVRLPLKLDAVAMVGSVYLLPIWKENK
jgi:hypothetical protein